MLKQLLCATTLLAALGSGLASAEEPLKINTAFAMPLSSEAQDGMFDHLMQEAFKRLGKQVVVQRPPAERALRYANAGIDDGDGPRIEGLEKTYPNLVRVPEKVIDVNFVAFTLGDLKFATGGWDTLKPYDVGIVKGWKILESNIQNTKSLTTANDPAHLFEMLKDGRIQVAVIGQETGSYIARQAGLAVNELAPAFATREMFVYLHKKHADLVQPMAEALKALKAEGRYTQIMQSR